MQNFKTILWNILSLGKLYLKLNVSTEILQYPDTVKECHVRCSGGDLSAEFPQEKLMLIKKNKNKI